jgi:hypothetical protein
VSDSLGPLLSPSTLDPPKSKQTAQVHAQVLQKGYLKDATFLVVVVVLVQVLRPHVNVHTHIRNTTS